MWVLVTRCEASDAALYASLLAAGIRRGAIPVHGEWGRSVTLIHGPVWPRLRQGTWKRVAVRVTREASLSRLEAMVEQRLGDIYGFVGAVAGIAAPLAALFNVWLGVLLGAASFATGIYSVLTSHVDFNWVSSLLEEACLDAKDYQGVVRDTGCSVECSPVRQGYACSIQGVAGPEIIGASLAIIGFGVAGRKARSGGLHVEYWCDTLSCTLLFRGHGGVKPTIETALLVSTLVAKIAC